MSLGKNIYKSRTKKNLSQSELAEILDVSRQSVSKWETDSAIPDLDKLIKMCDVFEVTLDELTDRTPQEKACEKTVTVIERTSSFTTAKIVGYILLSATLIASILLFTLADDIEDFYISLPILLSTITCSIICLCVKNNAGYWCIWVALSPICIFSFHIVGLPILSMICGTQILVYTAMIFIANKKFKGYTVQTNASKTILLTLGFFAGIAVYIATLFFIPLEWITMCIINYIIYLAFALLLTYSVCYIRSFKNK